MIYQKLIQASAFRIASSGGGGGGSSVTWDTTIDTSDVNYTNGGLTAEQADITGTNPGHTRDTQGNTYTFLSGTAYYAEVVCTETENLADEAVGITTMSVATMESNDISNDAPNNNENSWCVSPSAGFVFEQGVYVGDLANGGLSDGDIIGVLLDCPNGSVKYYVNNSLEYTSPIPPEYDGETFYVNVYMGEASPPPLIAFTGAFKASDQTYSAPSGQAWET